MRWHNLNKLRFKFSKQSVEITSGLKSTHLGEVSRQFLEVDVLGASTLQCSVKHTSQHRQNGLQVGALCRLQVVDE